MSVGGGQCNFAGTVRVPPPLHATGVNSAGALKTWQCLGHCAVRATPAMTERVRWRPAGAVWVQPRAALRVQGAGVWSVTGFYWLVMWGLGPRFLSLVRFRASPSWRCSAAMQYCNSLLCGCEGTHQRAPTTTHPGAPISPFDESVWWPRGDPFLSLPGHP